MTELERNAPVTWVQRHTRSIVVGAVAGLVLMAAGLSVLVLTIIMAPVKSSDVYAEALERAAGDRRVIDRLGEPIEPGWFLTGRIEHSGPRGGYADMTIPLEGPKGEGNLYVLGREQRGGWTITKLVLNPTHAATRVDLLTDAE